MGQWILWSDSYSSAATLPTRLCNSCLIVVISCRRLGELGSNWSTCIDSARSVPAGVKFHATRYFSHSSAMTSTQVKTSTKFVTLNFCLMYLPSPSNHCRSIRLSVVMSKLIGWQPFWVEASHLYSAAISCHNPRPDNFISEMRCTAWDLVQCSWRSPTLVTC